METAISSPLHSPTLLPFALQKLLDAFMHIAWAMIIGEKMALILNADQSSLEERMSLFDVGRLIGKETHSWTYIRKSLTSSTSVRDPAPSKRNIYTQHYIWLFVKTYICALCLHMKYVSRHANLVYNIVFMEKNSSVYNTLTCSCCPRNQRLQDGDHLHLNICVHFSLDKVMPHHRKFAFCAFALSIFSSFIHSTEDAHVPPHISTKGEHYSFPSGWGTSGVNTSVSFSSHLSRWTNQFCWSVLLPDNGKFLSREMPVACVHAKWASRTILHPRPPERGFLRDKGQRRESLTSSIFSGCKYSAGSAVFKGSQFGLRFQLHSPVQLYQSF